MTLGIKFDSSTLLWPQGNSEVERFNQPLEKAIRAASIEKELETRTSKISIELQIHSTCHN